jgi:hypothetical protein
MDWSSGSVREVCRGAAVLTVPLVLSACDAMPAPERSAAGGVVHPIEHSVTAPGAGAVVAVDRRSGGSLPVSMQSFIERLAGRRTAAEIGVMDGGEEYVFGTVADVAFLEADRVAVLDRQASLLRVYDTNGRYRYTAGGFGDGPGELDVPIALVIAEPGLWIIDAARMVHRFRLHEDTLSFIDRFGTDGFAHDACGTGSGVLLHAPARMPGASAAGVLHLLDDAGSPTVTFAEPYPHPDRLVSE